MRIWLMVAVGALTACGPADAPEPNPSDVPAYQGPASEGTASDMTIAPEMSPPGEAEFRSAWVEQCSAQESDIGSAVCKAKSLGSDGFSCDFALGDDEYRRYSADLERSGTVWALADPRNACTPSAPD